MTQRKPSKLRFTTEHTTNYGNYGMLRDIYMTNGVYMSFSCLQKLLESICFSVVQSLLS